MVSGWRLPAWGCRRAAWREMWREHRRSSCTHAPGAHRSATLPAGHGGPWFLHSLVRPLCGSRNERGGMRAGECGEGSQCDFDSEEAFRRAARRVRRSFRGDGARCSRCESGCVRCIPARVPYKVLFIARVLCTTAGRPGLYREPVRQSGRRQGQRRSLCGPVGQSRQCPSPAMKPHPPSAAAALPALQHGLWPDLRVRGSVSLVVRSFQWTPELTRESAEDGRLTV